MKRLVTALLIVLTLPATAAFVGCGGTSKNDIRKMMAQRSIDRGEPDEQEEAESTAAAPAPPSASPATAPADTGSEYVTAEQTPSTPAPTEGEASHAPPPAAPTARVVSPDPVERAALAARNLERIAQGLKAYAEDKEYYPRGATIDRLKTPLLSWRVQLLPYLGELQLYKQFNHDEPWNTPHNLRLLDKMPAVFRSPERTDNKTCVLAFDSSSSLLGQSRPVHYTALEDGSSNTLALVEAGVEAAVEWTRPADYVVDEQAPLAGIGGQRGGRVYVAWADGTTGSLATDTSSKLVLAAITYEAGDVFKRYLIDQPIDPSAVTAVAASGGGSGAAAPVGPAGRITTSSGSGGAVSRGNQLASSYWAAAAAAKQQGLSSDAWQWLAGAICAGAPSPQWASEFEWVPALRRPVLGMHVGVGVFGDQPRDDRGRGRDDDDDRGARRRRLAETTLDRRQRVLDASAPVGAPLLGLIEEHAAKVAPPAISSGGYDPLTKRRRPEDLPPVTYLEPTRGVVELVRDGAAKGCDVVAAVEVETRADGQRYVTVTLYDVFRKTRLETTGRVLSPADVRDAAFLRDREYQESRWRLKDFLEDKLSPGPWPVTMTPKVAASRLETLGASRSPWPLTALMEMRYYRAQGLVDDAQLLRAMTALLGDEAMPLLLGGETKQRRVLREWLPSDDPAAVVAVADQRRRQADDEDD